MNYPFFILASIFATMVCAMEYQSMAFGHDHLIALNTQGQVVSCGFGAKGQLGHGQQQGIVVEPSVIAGLSDHRVIELAAGSSFSLALTDKGKVFFWGNSSTSGNDLCLTPEKIDFLDEKQIIHVAAGKSHWLALSSDGRVFLWDESRVAW